jgi:ferredoxin
LDKREVTREVLAALAGELGIQGLGFLPLEQWPRTETGSPGTAPWEVWPPVKSLIVLGIPEFPVESLPAAKEFGGWDVRNGLLDTAAYRLSLYLNRQGYPSVNIPVDTSGKQGVDRSTVPVFSHQRAAFYAGLATGPEGGGIALALCLGLYHPGFWKPGGRVMKGHITRGELRALAEKAGIDYLGFAPVSRWDSGEQIPDAVHPRSLWGKAKTVIVLGAPIWLPLIEASPSVLGREQVFVTDKLFEKASYRLLTLLNERGYGGINIPRYPSGDSDAFFPAEPAGYYAGLGVLGWNHRLLTEDYGARFQIKALFTDAELKGDPVYQNNLCTLCGNCEKICPAGALRAGRRDTERCRAYTRRLEQAYCDCGACIKVCPAGADRKLFNSENFTKYFQEEAVLARNPGAKEYKSWVHIRSFGSADPADVPADLPGGVGAKN